MAAEKVEIEPKQVVFVGPFTSQKKVQLKLRNNSEERIAYKMKSTRLHRFRMSPPFG